MPYEEITAIISNVGFPIAVALYFMFKVERTMKELREAILKLKVAIEVKNI